MGCATAYFTFGPVPWGPGEGPKGQISLISIKKSISKILKPIVCVFSQIKDIKPIRRDFHSVTWVLPKGNGLWGIGGSKI